MLKRFLVVASIATFLTGAAPPTLAQVQWLHRDVDGNPVGPITPNNVPNDTPFSVDVTDWPQDHILHIWHTNPTDPASAIGAVAIWGIGNVNVLIADVAQITFPVSANQPVNPGVSLFRGLAYDQFETAGGLLTPAPCHAHVRCGPTASHPRRVSAPHRT